MFLLTPLLNLSRRGQKWLFWLAFAGTLTLSAVLHSFDLITESAPAGIVSFEFAGNLPTVQLMLQEWGEAGQVNAGISLGLDYLFMPFYATMFAVACLWVSQDMPAEYKGLAKLGRWLALAQFLAMGLDGVENYALIKLLLGSQGTHWPPLAYWCAAFKFLLIVLALLYVLLGVVVILIKRFEFKR